MGGWTSEEPLKEVASDLGHLDSCPVLVIVLTLLYGPAWCFMCLAGFADTMTVFMPGFQRRASRPASRSSHSSATSAG